MEFVLLFLALIGTATPFILLALSWMRGLSKDITSLRLDVVERSARQDTTLDDHERRLTNLESYT